MGDWLLQELRALKMVRMPKKMQPSAAWLKRGCDLESEEDHCKFRELVREFLNDWDALGVFVKNSQRPQL
jgi:hypothetical protein